MQKDEVFLKEKIKLKGLVMLYDNGTHIFMITLRLFYICYNLTYSK